MIEIFRFVVRLVSAEYNNKMHPADTILKVRTHGLLRYFPHECKKYV